MLPVILRLVQSKTTLFETLEFQLDFLEEKDINTIEWMLENHAESVMFIYDGLDEYSTSACRDILLNIKGVKYPGNTVVITSRGEAVSKLNDWNVVMDLEAELQGFGSKEIFKYVNNYFDKNKDINVRLQQDEERTNIHLGLPSPKDTNVILEEKQCKDINVRLLLEKVVPIDELDRLQGKCKSATSQLLNVPSYRSDLHEMATNPGQLGILCFLWEQSQNISENRGEMYQQFIEVILQLACKRYKKPIPPRLTAVEYSRETLLKMGKLANTRNTIVFSMREVEETVGEDAMEWGLLFCSHPVSRMRESEASFLHKTMQEWLAAFYIANTKGIWKDTTYTDFNDMRTDKSFHQFLLHRNKEIMVKIWEINIIAILEKAEQDKIRFLSKHPFLQEKKKSIFLAKHYKRLFLSVLLWIMSTDVDNSEIIRLITSDKLNKVVLYIPPHHCYGKSKKNAN